MKGSQPVPFHVRDPRLPLPAASPFLPAERLADPSLARIALVQCMPPHNGLEPMIEAARKHLSSLFPKARIETIVRRDFLVDDPAERSAIQSVADAAILFAGPAASSVHATWAFAASLERSGLCAALAVPRSLAGIADFEGRERGVPLSFALTDERNPAASAPAIVEALLAPAPHPYPAESTPPAPGTYLCGDSEEAVRSLLCALGTTDGLPVVMPTDRAIAEMLAGTSRASDAIVCATLRPEGLPVSAEMVAINSVMAGASPAHLPIILAATSLYGGIELESMTRSVNSFAFTHLLSGPLARELGVSGGTGAIGHSGQANAAIARSIAFVLRNCGWQRIGQTATPTQGNAAGFGVFAENAAGSPWVPFHVDLGFAESETVLSLFTGGLAIVGNFYYQGLDNAARQALLFENRLGALLLVSAKRAAELAAQGMDRRDVCNHLHEHACEPLGDMRKSGFYPMMKAMIARGGGPITWPREYLTLPDDTIMPVYPQNGIRVAVVGDDVASVMQLWNSSLHASCRIEDWI
jgi:hypothetical protein